MGTRAVWGGWVCRSTEGLVNLSSQRSTVRATHKAQRVLAYQLPQTAVAQKRTLLPTTTTITPPRMVRPTVWLTQCSWVRGVQRLRAAHHTVPLMQPRGEKLVEVKLTVPV